MNKNNILKLLSLLLALCTVVSAAAALASCKRDGPSNDTTVAGNDTEPTDTEDENVWEYVRDPSLPDFATMVTLNTSDINSDFDRTGRGLVTVEQFIDGDTVHFWNNSRTEIIKVRFLAIDTPESTGKVEPWGKPASRFTKSKLQNAAEIVLESDEEGTATMDSTGDRYLAWVWYKPKNGDVWRNLNIEILADGLAMGKSSSSTRYGTVALNALTSARSEKLNL